MTILVKPCLHCQGKFSLFALRFREGVGKQCRSPKDLVPQGGFDITAAHFSRHCVWQVYIIKRHDASRHNCGDSTTADVIFIFFCFLCSGDRPSPPLTPLHDRRTTIALTQAVVQSEPDRDRGELSGVVRGRRGGQTKAQAGQLGRSDESCGWESVRLFNYVDITKCFLVVFLCVSSVRTFILN